MQVFLPQFIHPKLTRHLPQTLNTRQAIYVYQQSLKTDHHQNRNLSQNRTRSLTARAQQYARNRTVQSCQTKTPTGSDLLSRYYINQVRNKKYEKRKQSQSKHRIIIRSVKTQRSSKSKANVKQSNNNGSPFFLTLSYNCKQKLESIFSKAQNKRKNSTDNRKIYRFPQVPKFTKEHTQLSERQVDFGEFKQYRPWSPSKNQGTQEWLGQ